MSSVNKKNQPDESQALAVAADPVLFLMRFVKQKPRDYQIPILRYEGKRIVCRMGRRTGKTWTMAAHMLWYALTHKNSTCLIVCPFDAQVEVIVDQVREFISEGDLRGLVTKDLKSPPQQIRFTNGAKIKGFTAGTKSGNKAASVRGQKADWIYLDEMDYMSDKDFQTVYAIALEAPKRIGVFCCSTPTGRRGKFYEMCMDPVTIRDVGWKQWHLPSTVNPEYNDEMEAEFRASFDPVEYEHEVLAEFGTETSGVFNKQLLERCLEEFDYYKLNNVPSTTNVRVMGVDWDKYQSGTSIVVIEAQPRHLPDGKANYIFKVVYREEVPRTQFTYDTAIKRIILLDRAFKPNHIYVDRGSGEFQIEKLHKYGIAHPDTNLHKKVVGMAFNQSIDIRDPFTKTADKKMLKHLMINELQNLIEREQISFRLDDPSVWRQFEAYQVLGLSPSGAPRYSSKNEHFIDACGLAIHAIVTHYPELAKVIFEPVYAQEVSKINNFQDMLPGGRMSFQQDHLQLPAWYTNWDEPLEQRPGVPRPMNAPLPFKKRATGLAKASFDRGGVSRGNSGRGSF